MFNWKLCWAPNYLCKNIELNTISKIENSGYSTMDATVPGNYEIDFMKAGLLDDIYYSTNTLKTQDYENLHFWYYTKIDITDTRTYLEFEGIDTIADIYTNGILEKSVDNMFLSHDVYPQWNTGENEIVVHIKPVCIEGRKYTVPASNNSFKYNASGLYIRKASHMYVWDIMPRIVSAGIFKPVNLKQIKPNRIKDVYFVTNTVDLENKKANIRFYIDVDADGDFMKDYTYTVEGVCADSSFKCSDIMWHTQQNAFFDVENCYFWWPKNSGKPYLYDTKVCLYYKGKLCDTYNLKVGIRTVELDRTDVSNRNADGEFCFKVNGKKIFILGTNWVPLDALHSNDINRIEKAVELVDEIGCNMIRCWGGNLYENDLFYELCDEKGILVWQDFAMACGEYPLDDFFVEKLKEEALYQVKRLRNHASLALWAGDNEVDLWYIYRANFKRDPNKNILTRKVLPQIIFEHDYSRPYLASSPFVSEKAYNSGEAISGEIADVLPENHIWGPRDYFKGEFYQNIFCHFASETGYHGFPSTKSLKKFLKNPEILFKDDGNPTDEYLVHAASAELDPKCEFAYRIRLAYDQVLTLFGDKAESLDDFCRQSQISQAEAKKFFIERFRIGKWNRTGIIWWNLLDGWPQISDAIIDYYFTKKIAFSYIKRCQQPVCLMFDEPKDNEIALFGVNDLPENKEVSYEVCDILNNKVVLSGKSVINADKSQKIGSLKLAENEKTFYLIKWNMDGKEYKNHYFTNIKDVDYNNYIEALKKSEMYDFEGF